MPIPLTNTWSKTIDTMTTNFFCDDYYFFILPFCACLGSSLLCDMVVICEPKPISNSLLRVAKNVGLKLLTPQWIVQCLIQGKQLQNYKDFWFNSK